ncbi:MAG: cytochrome c [Rhodospirillaceae bacterium]|jgi:cytochrome c556|nr:cytochrome c [Rhodospirillaceae bacterium]
MGVLRYGVLSALICLFTVSAPMDGALAQSAGKLLKQRQAIMKEFSSHTKAIKKFVKGPSKKLKGKKLKKATKRLGTTVDMELRAQALAGQGTRLAKYFPKGTGTADGVGRTRSKQAIWSDWAGFQAATANFVKLAGNLEKAAASADKGQIGTALAALGKKGCGGCHRNFRAKKKKKK